VLRYLRNSGNTEPWLWLEVDTVPMVADWADRLQREYHSCGKPLLGFTRKTVYKNADKSVYHIDGDDMLLGVAVYSAGFGDGEVAPLLRDLLRAPREAPNQPFDVYLRWAMKRFGWAHTDLVAHCWKSREWAWDGPLSCFDSDGIWRAFSANSAVLIHGCKDKSLYRISMNQSLTVISENTETTDSAAPTQVESVGAIEYYVPREIPPLAAAIVDPVLADEVVAVLESAVPAKPDVAAVIRSRFVLGPVTAEEEAGWPCTKQDLEAFLKSEKKAAKRGSRGSVRLAKFMERFGWTNKDTARRALRHWHYSADPPHTFVLKLKK